MNIKEFVPAELYKKAILESESKDRTIRRLEQEIAQLKICIERDYDFETYFEAQESDRKFMDEMSRIAERLGLLSTVCLNDCNTSKEVCANNLSPILDGYKMICNSTLEKFPNAPCYLLAETIDSLKEKVNKDDEIPAVREVIQSLPNLCDFIMKMGCEDHLRSIAMGIGTRSWQKELSHIKSILYDAFLCSDNYLDEFPGEISYMRRNNKLAIFPYEYTDKYNSETINVYEYQDDPSLKYVMHEGKPLFFPAWNDITIRNAYRDLVEERDINSPHRYFDDKGCDFKEGDIFVDVGAAEGIISLDVIDLAEKVYLIESDELWIKALKKTFGDYEDKIEIIRRYANYRDYETDARLDTILKEYTDKRIFIKMDIEGMEIDALHGCTETLQNNDCRVACACYHTNGQEKEIRSFFDAHGYMNYCSEGYMLFIAGYLTLKNGKYERLEPPFFRKTMVRAIKQKD